MVSSRSVRLLVVWAIVALLPGLCTAATFIVTKETDDDGPCAPDDCALREAVLAANALPGPDLIILPGGTHRLTILGIAGENASLSGDLDIHDHLEIRGDPTVPTIIESAVGNERVIQAADGSLTLVNLEITGGQTSDGGGGFVPSAPTSSYVTAPYAETERGSMVAVS
jgi:CSLREA domain-containing protein